MRSALLLIGSVSFLGVFGYLAASLIYSRVLLGAADTAYSTAVQDQAGLAPTIRSLKVVGYAGDAGAVTMAQLQQNRKTLDTMAVDADNALRQVDSDDQSLADASMGLASDQWLTVLARSSLDRDARRVALERVVLADARTIDRDYGQLVAFTESLYDVLLDFDSISRSAQARNLDATELSITKLQADTAKATSLDKAPGLPPEVDTLMRDIQSVVNDTSNLLKAATSRNVSTITAIEAAGSKDVARIRAFNFKSIVPAIAAFYSPLVDAYNADVARAARA